MNTRILKPEAGWATEIGAEWDITDELTVGADAYCTWLKDEVFYNAVVHDNENCGDLTLRRGFDVHASWERDKLAGLSVAASCVKATFDGGAFDGSQIPLVPGMTLTVNGRMWLWNDCFVFGGYRFQGGMYSCSDFRNAFGKMDGYGVLHVGATYGPTCAGWLEGLELSVCVDNLLGERYCDYATYGTQCYPAAGRRFTFTVRYEF